MADLKGDHWQTDFRRHIGAAPEKSVFLFHGREEVVKRRDILRAAQEKEAVRAERVVKGRDAPVCTSRSK